MDFLPKLLPRKLTTEGDCLLFSLLKKEGEKEHLCNMDPSVYIGHVIAPIKEITLLTASVRTRCNRWNVLCKKTQNSDLEDDGVSMGHCSLQIGPIN